jgi:hypothetical protein
MILKVLSSEMDPAEIKFIRKACIKERGVEVFRKIRQSPIRREPFKDSAPPLKAVGNSGTKCYRGNEIHHAVVYLFWPQQT